MARTFGKLLCEVWDDPKHSDFIDLPSDAKVLFWAFCSQRDITACGIVPLIPRRWRRWFHGDQARAEAALDELVAGEFVLIDDDTAEVWVRSFITHDGRLDNTNLNKSVHAAVPNVHSEALREACYRLLDALGTPSGRPSDAVPNDRPVDNSSSLLSDDETPGGRPFEGPSDAVANADGKGSRSSKSQQPAASDLDHPPTAGRREPDGPVDERVQAVIDHMVSLRLRQDTNVRNPPGLARKLQREFPGEHGATIERLFEQFPGAPISNYATAIITESNRCLAGYARNDDVA